MFYSIQNHRMAKNKFKRPAIITSIIIVAIVVLIIVFISPITKYLIEKYDVKYLGREVKTSLVYVNPFTGYIHIRNLKLYELNSDSALFIKSDGLSVNFNWTALIFKKTYELSSLTVDHPVFNITQQRQTFNFDDIISKFTPKEKKLVKDARTKLNILDIEIIEGTVHYKEKVIPVDYFLKNINIVSPGMWWNRDTIAVKFDLKNGPSTGEIKGNTTINLTKKNYRLNLNIKDFDLGFMEQYILDLANYGHLAAKLDLDIHAKGGFSSVLETNANGWVAIRDLHFGKKDGDDFVSIKKLYIGIKEFNPKEFKYNMDSVIITSPYFVYETYDYLDNLQRMFGAGGSKIKEAHADSSKFNPIFTIATQVQKIAENFLKSYYQVGRVALYNGDIRFNDFSIREKFAIGLNPLYVTANKLDKNSARLKIDLSSAMKPYGNISATFSVDPKNNTTFEADYSLNKIPLSIANPYLITYTSFPLDRGSLDFKGHMNASNGALNSQNHLVIVDPRVGKRLKKKKDTKWIPVPLVMALVRENGNMIDYQIPVSGNLNNPKIHFKDIIFDLLRNIFVKPVTAPYAYKVKNIENEIEKSLTLTWETRQPTLRKAQDKFIDKIADFLKKTPNSSITVQPMMYTDKEKEYLLFYEAKKKYYKSIHGNLYTSDDSAAVEKMSNKDSSFFHFLNKRYGDDVFTIQQKCLNYVGSTVVNAKYAELVKNREKKFLQYFKENGTSGRVKINTTQSTIPFNGFSFYKIKYNGELPKSLVMAYEDIEELDEKAPREKYKKIRKRNKKLRK